LDEIQDKKLPARGGKPAQIAVANMNNELRTPINAIIGVTEMPREDAEAATAGAACSTAWLGAGRHLLALINNNLSKIEPGRMEIYVETFPLMPCDRTVGGDSHDHSPELPV
jgi:signal transduction histidine kinase